MRAVVLGDVMTDVVARVSGPVAWDSDTPAEVTMRGGGAAANVAAWMAHNGADVTLVARRGDDALGLAAEAELSRAGVRCWFAVDPHRPTGTCVVVSDGSARTMFPDIGANAGWRSDDVPDDLLRGGDLLYVSAYPLLTPDWIGVADVMRRARAAGMAVAVDPAAASLLAELGPEEFWARCGDVDLLLPNRDEAAVLAQNGDAEESAATLLAHAAVVVVKLDRDGAVWRDRTGRHALGTAQAADVVDTTGAGDAFAAGLLTAWLAGESPADQLAAGGRTAAACLGVIGGRPPVT